MSIKDCLLTSFAFLLALCQTCTPKMFSSRRTKDVYWWGFTNKHKLSFHWKTFMYCYHKMHFTYCCCSCLVAPPVENHYRPPSTVDTCPRISRPFRDKSPALCLNRRPDEPGIRVLVREYRLRGLRGNLAKHSSTNPSLLSTWWSNEGMEDCGFFVLHLGYSWGWS